MPIAVHTLATLAAQAEIEELEIAPLPHVVHQATGMISVQLGVSLEEALRRLEARAIEDRRQLVDLANDVVDRRVRFED
jgi:AmiR/NasT family two-component response regulator